MKSLKAKDTLRCISFRQESTKAEAGERNFTSSRANAFEPSRLQPLPSSAVINRFLPLLSSSQVKQSFFSNQASFKFFVPKLRFSLDSRWLSVIDLGEQLIYIVFVVRVDESGDKFEDNSSFIRCQFGFCPACGSALLECCATNICIINHTQWPSWIARGKARESAMAPIGSVHLIYGACCELVRSRLPSSRLRRFFWSFSSPDVMQMQLHRH